MQVPNKLKIGGIIYDIEVVGEDLLPEQAGNIAVVKKRIQILDASDDFMFVTLLHEIFHAINMEMPEERIEFLAQAFYQVLVDNPQLLMEKPKEKIVEKGKRGVGHGTKKNK